MHLQWLYLRFCNIVFSFIHCEVNKDVTDFVCFHFLLLLLILCLLYKRLSTFKYFSEFKPLLDLFRLSTGPLSISKHSYIRDFAPSYYQMFTISHERVLKPWGFTKPDKYRIVKVTAANNIIVSTSRIFIKRNY
jgi:hypothetical protein